MDAFKCVHFVISSRECFCIPCEYMRSLSARWESQKSADAESPFLCLTFPCLQHFASRTGTKILAQVVKLPALTLFLPLPLSFTFSLSFIPNKKFTDAANKYSIAKLLYKAGILCIRQLQTEQNCFIGIRENKSLRHAIVLNHWT